MFPLLLGSSSFPPGCTFSGLTSRVEAGDGVKADGESEVGVRHSGLMVPACVLEVGAHTLYSWSSFYTLSQSPACFPRSKGCGQLARRLPYRTHRRPRSFRTP